MPRRKRSNGRDRTNTEIRESFKDLCEFIQSEDLILQKVETSDVMDEHKRAFKLGRALLLYERLFPGKAQQKEATP